MKMNEFFSKATSASNNSDANNLFLNRTDTLVSKNEVLDAEILLVKVLSHYSYKSVKILHRYFLECSLIVILLAVFHVSGEAGMHIYVILVLALTFKHF